MATHKKIAQPKRGTKRASAKPVTAEIKRAAERAGKGAHSMPPWKSRWTADQLVAWLAPNLTHATELTGEALATMVKVHDGSEVRIQDLNALLWQLRWELGVTPKAPDEQAAGGAS